jgi:hypothetical protein
VFTAAAAGVAVWLAVREGRWRRADQAERDAERADQDAAQARLVTVEPTYDPFSDFRGVDYETTVKILNASTRPILDVKVTDVRNEDAADLGWKFDAIGYLDGQPSEARVLPAGDTYKLPIGHVDASGKAVYPGGEDHVTIEFTDAAGLRWRRREKEAPERAITTPQPAD